MSVIKNFVAANKRDDLVPPTLARSIIGLVRGIQRNVKNSGLSVAITEFKNHALNLENQHKLTIDEFSSQLIEILYTNYLQILAQDPTEKDTTPLTPAQFLDWISNPIVFVEVCRRLVLDSYLYDDGVGNVTQPVYGLGDIYPDTPPPEPSYFVGYSMPDKFMSAFTPGLYQKILPTQSSKVTLGVSFIPPRSPDPTKTYTYTASLTNATGDGFLVNVTLPGDPTGGPSGLQAQALVYGMAPASAVVSTGTDFLAEGVLNYFPFTAAMTEPTVILSVDGTTLSIYYVIQTLIQKVTVSISGDVFDRPLDRIIISNVWDQHNDTEGGIKSLMVYPQLFSDAEVVTLFERL